MTISGLFNWCYFELHKINSKYDQLPKTQKWHKRPSNYRNKHIIQRKSYICAGRLCTNQYRSNTMQKWLKSNDEQALSDFFQIIREMLRYFDYFCVFPEFFTSRKSTSPYIRRSIASEDKLDSTQITFCGNSLILYFLRGSERGFSTKVTPQIVNLFR
jgi:hypothetical protein